MPYCSVFFTKIKEVFRLSDDFFTDSRAFPHRPGQQTEKFRPAIQPELPDRPQKRGEQGEERYAAAGSAQQDKATQLTVRLPQDEQGQSRPSGEAVE